MLHRLVFVGLLSICVAFAQSGVAGGFGSGVGGGQGTRVVAQPVDPTMAGQPRPGQQPQPAKEPSGIEGSVMNASTGEPLKRATVILMPLQPGPNANTPYSTMSDANGRFAMSGITPGSYRLMVERTGFVRSDQGSRGSGRQAPAITLVSGETLKEISIRMQPHAVIAGRVLDEEGEPLSGVQVQALSQRYMQGRRQLMPMQMSMTNDLGEYRIFGLPAGKYFVNAIYRSSGMSSMAVDRTSNGAAVPDESYPATYYPGALDASAAVPLQVVAGQPITSIDFNLRRVRTVRVKGKVRGPVQNGRSMVMLMQQNDPMGMSSRNGSSTQGSDGSFEIRGVTPGAYYVIAQQHEANAQYTGRLPINVGNSNVENLEVVVGPGATISGRIRIDGGDAQIKPTLAVVNLQPREFGPFGGGGSGIVGADSTFSITNVTPGSYRINVGSRGGQQFYVKSVHAGDQELPERELTIADGTAQVLTVVLGTATGQVSGQVLADSGVATQGATVVLVPSTAARQADQPRIATADQNGKFSLPSVPPGDYTVYAWDDVEMGAWADPEFLARFENKGKKITLKENESVTADTPLLTIDSGQ